MASGKKLKAFPLPVGTTEKPGMFADQSDTCFAGFVDGYLRLANHRSAGPAGTDALLDPRSGKLTPIGDPALFVSLGAGKFVVGNEEITYDEKKGSQSRVTLTTFDLVSGKHVTTTLPNQPRPEPETRSMLHTKLEGGKLGILYANPPGFVSYDPAKHALGTPSNAPLCP